jgi:uncharacterized protein (DUF1684 family)
MSLREERRLSVRLLAGLMFAVLAGACTSGPPPPVDTRPYEIQVLAGRAEKDQFFKTHKDSPLLPEHRGKFTSLAYYPVDSAYRVPAALTEEAADRPVIIELQTSTGEIDRMRRVGTLGFTLSATAYKLSAFAPAEARVINRLFVPFGDLTNVDETYRGGRYLDLQRTSTGLYDLDFNQAYHPYCVYNPNYVCPLPPRENRLVVAIRAGERLAMQ